MKVSILAMGGRPGLHDDAAAVLKRAIARAGLDASALEVPDELTADVSVLETFASPAKARDLVDLVRRHFEGARVAYVTGAASAENLYNALAVRAADHLTRRVENPAEHEFFILVILQAQVQAPAAPGGPQATEAAGPLAEAPDVLLTATEREVLQLLVEGHTDQEIASELYLSRRTVQNHLARIRLKTGFSRRAEVLRWGARRIAG